MTRPTDADLAAWRATVEAATPGPWEESGVDDDLCRSLTVIESTLAPGSPIVLTEAPEHLCGWSTDERDAAFVVTARSALPRLLDVAEAFNAARAAAGDAYTESGAATLAEFIATVLRSYDAAIERDMQHRRERDEAWNEATRCLAQWWEREVLGLRRERDALAAEHAGCGDALGHLAVAVRHRDEARAEVERLREAVRAYLRWHDLNLGDDYFDAERRAVRMPLDALIRERETP